MTLNVESKSHVHAIAPSETGTAQGSRSTNRARRRPRNALRSTCAAAVASTIASACDPSVTSTVFHVARRNTGSARMRAYCSKPTQWNVRLPAVESLKLSRMTSTNGTPTSRNT
jgi:hypothetical protein